MANRYLVGSGSFTSTSIWSNTYNGSSGASIPVSGDIIHVDANRNITSGLPNDSNFDFIVYLGANISSGVTLGLSGSPTFRSLIIQSKNSAAHTVSIDDYNIYVDRFVALGTSSNDLTISAPGGPASINFISDNSTSYGQYVNMVNLAPSAWDGSSTNGFDKPYLGANSSANASSLLSWLIQGPPKISTLVDPLTTAPGSNPNWTVSGTVTQVTTGKDGGGYGFSDFGEIFSNDTYDLLGSEIVIEVPPTPIPPDFLYGGVNLNQEYTGGSVALTAATREGIFSEQLVSRQDINDDLSIVFDGKLWDYPTTTHRYMKLALSTGGVLSAESSLNGRDWITNVTEQLTPDEILPYRAIRIHAGYNGWAMGSINPSLAPQNPGAFLPFFMP